MEEPQERRPRLKFKKILFHGGPLMPQGYRLATVEVIRSNLQTLKKKKIPVKKINPLYVERSGAIRLLDGWVTDDFSTIYETPNYDCVWNAVVKEKTWDSGKQKWQNCAGIKICCSVSGLFYIYMISSFYIFMSWIVLITDLYSSGSNSLRKEMYRGVKPTPRGIDTAWFQAYRYEDVEALYWLWRNFPYSFDPALFKRECRPEHINTHYIPLREMVMSYGSRGNTRSTHELDMTNPSPETQAVLRYAIDRSGDELEWTYLYGPTWAVALVEFAIEIHGQTFVDTANSIAFVNAEAIPITTKLLSLLSSDRLQTQIENVQLPVAEVLIEAVKRGYKDLVEHLLNHDRRAINFPEKVGKEEKSLFHYALPHEKVFSLLKDKYGNSFDNIITREDTLGRNVLHWAAKRCYASYIVDRVLERPVSKERERLIYSKDHQSRTLWHVAAFKEDIGMINKLLDYLEVVDSSTRTDYIQATDSFGQTALQIAASEGHSELVKILISRGSCPLKERDGRRKTALHNAAQVEDTEAALATCGALLEHDRLSPSERSLLLWASATGIGTADEMEGVHKKVQKYLQTQKKEYREPLLRAAAINDNVEIAWELLSRGADIADICDQGWTNSLQSPEKVCVQNGMY